MHKPVSELKQFLIAAKQATYAAQGDDASVAPLLLDSKQLEYREDQFIYRDIYVGMFRFVGQEIVYLADRAVWSMSYSGGLCAGVEPTSARSIYAFLRHALQRAPLDVPLRGPASFEQDGLHYNCERTGSLEQFHGMEVIERGTKHLYELYFSGGQLL